MTNNNLPVIDICGKRTLEYVLECLAKFNRGIENLRLRAIGRNITRGVEVTRILQDQFKINMVIDSEIKSIQIKGNDVPCLEINLLFDTDSKVAETKPVMDSKFIEYPVYHLLLDWQLYRNGGLSISDSDDTLLLEIKKTSNGSVEYKSKINLNENRDAYNWARAALCRAGLLFPGNWERIAKVLSKYDDIILGIDTNILYNCSLSEHLNTAFSLIASRQYVHTPNWILYAIPNAVMHELEEAANIRDEGKLDHPGRMGYRALQEIMELSLSLDMTGVSLIIVGESNPILDTRVEIQGLRKDLHIARSKESKTRLPKPQKVSSGDMIIRDQFKRFLRQIDFHKGTHFITADKSNAALAEAEGLHSIYVQSHHMKDKMVPLEVDGITVVVPIGKLIYEMAVQFGTIRIKWKNSEDGKNRQIEIGCDLKGESLDTWIQRCLRMNLNLLSEGYKGRLNLNYIAKVWQELTKNFGELDAV